MTLYRAFERALQGYIGPCKRLYWAVGPFEGLHKVRLGLLKSYTRLYRAWKGLYEAVWSLSKGCIRPHRALNKTICQYMRLYRVGLGKGYVGPFEGLYKAIYGWLNGYIKLCRAF